MERLDPTEQRRAQLRRRAECRFVTPAEFCRLLVSTRRLVRSNLPAARLRGLRDEATGECFVVEEEALLRGASQPGKAKPAGDVSLSAAV